MLVASAAKGHNELIGALDRVCKLIPRDFEPGDIVMVANAKPAKT